MALYYRMFPVNDAIARKFMALWVADRLSGDLRTVYCAVVPSQGQTEWCLLGSEKLIIIIKGLGDSPFIIGGIKKPLVLIRTKWRCGSIAQKYKSGESILLGNRICFTAQTIVT